ncbi:MAG TPA: DPP IV N-terminal domain-containing protein [Candidatus Baltobacteraceae bacterium]|jgi:dipeptidyl-peptidase-4
MLFALLLAVTLPAAGQRPLTIEDIYAQHPVSGTPPSAFLYAPDGNHYAFSVPGAREDDPPVLHVHDVRDGRDAVLQPAKSASRGSRSREISQVVWSHDGTRVAFLASGALHVADADGTHDRTLAADADDPQWSPGDTALAFVHDDELYEVTTAARERRLTFDGSETRINGDPDWLYSEELAVEHAFAWSPDGRSIAYLSFDESPIVPFPIQDFLPRINTVEEQRYPLAGSANPKVSLRVLDVASARSHAIYDGAPHDEYVLSFVWTPDGHSVVDEILDRSQHHLRLIAFGAATGDARTLLTESDAKFLDNEDSPPPHFLRDGKQFLWLSERAGVEALYRIDTATGAAVRLTGNYPVSDVEQVDERRGVAYVTAFYPTRRDAHLLLVSLRGGAMHDLTPGQGSHLVVMPERGRTYVDHFSSLTTPPQIVRHSLDGGRDVTLFHTPDLSRFELGTTRRLEVPSKWGALDASLTVPAGFDPSKRYPVIFAPYGGPLPVADGNEGTDQWPGLFTHFLAQHGFLVFSLAGPASNNDRASDARLFYTRMGEIALAGQLAGVDWLKTQPYADPARLGITGWSYGGYLTAFALTHAPGVFKSGIAGAPPADWHYYDTAYTERYMGMPNQQRAAYRTTSVLPAAAQLRSTLLILQGTSDDNVHLMNSISLLQAFISKGKTVEYFAYPGSRHGVRSVAGRRDIGRRMLAWWERTL